MTSNPLNSLSLAAVLAALAACGTVPADPDGGVEPDAADAVDGGVGDSDATEEEADVDPPETTIDVAPPSPLNSRSSTIEFSSSEPDSSFFCSLDGAPFTTCTSPYDVDRAADGPVQFAVYAVDAADNADPTPASHGWIVDTVPPSVTIASGPSTPTSSSAAGFTFSADEVADFECRVDGGAWAACTSPADYSGITDGGHTFEVRATDAAGNVGNDQYVWTMDQSAPDVSIDLTPDNPTNSTNASFTFAAEGGTTLSCRIDGGAWTGCDSATTMAYSGLGANTEHTFDVRATDGAGNSAVASYTWNIDTVAPVVSITNKPADPTNLTTAKFGFSVNELADVDCKLDSGAWGACDSTSSMNWGTVASNTTHTFYVSATDAAGNTGSAQYSWTIDTQPPNTQITAAPPRTYPVDYATFSFNSPDDASATFQCSINGSAYANCTSPKSYSGLGYAAHTFAVRAVDPLNNIDGSPASAGWTAARGLVLHYPFDRHLRNVSPLGKIHNGDGASYSFIAGRSAEAVAFNGARSSVVKLDQTILPMSNDDAYTISLWFYDTKQVADTVNRYLINFYDAEGGIKAYRYLSRDFEVHVEYGTDRTSTERASASVNASQSWQNVMFEYRKRGGDLYIYHNLQLVGTIKNSQAGHIFSRGQLPSMAIGGASLFAIDDLKVYNRVYSTQEKCEVILGGTWVIARESYCK